MQEAEACLPGPLIRVAPDVFIDLEPEMELIVHGQFGFFNRHIYLGTFYDQTVVYCIVSDPIAVHVDLEAKAIRKYLQL